AGLAHVSRSGRTTCRAPSGDTARLSAPTQHLHGAMAISHVSFGSGRSAMDAKAEKIALFRYGLIARLVLEPLPRGLFEKCGVSFVSVTQEFNTSTSLGRLTLHILLSFAQFEREIISERTRDKMAAARRKGQWLGGTPVLGYDVDPEGGRLVVNPAEAERVREIFAISAACASVAAVQKEVHARGLLTKDWTSKSGKHHGGRAFTPSRLDALLRNVVYIGEVSHKGVVYPGEQPAIMDRALWER